MKISTTIITEIFSQDGDQISVSYDTAALETGVTVRFRGEAANREVTMALEPCEVGELHRALTGPLKSVAYLIENNEGFIFQAAFTNRGEPYREGIALSVRDQDYRSEFHIFILDYDLARLTKFLAESCELG